MKGRNGGGYGRKRGSFWDGRGEEEQNLYFSLTDKEEKIETNN